MVWARAESRRLPGLRGPRPDPRGFFYPGDGRALRRDRRERGGATTPSRPSTPWPIRRGRGDQGARHRRAGAARAWRRRARSAATWSRRSAAAWWATSPASAPRSTSAACGTCRCRPRSSPRSTPPTAARPASTCPRARTTWAPTTSPRRCCATRPPSTRFRREELAAGYAEVVKTALIAGGPLWAARARQGGDGGRGRSSWAACGRKLAVVAEDERDAGSPPGAQPRPHGRPRDRGGHRLPPLPPRRGGGDRAAGRAAPLRPGRAARRGGASCSRRAGCP